MEWRSFGLVRWEGDGDRSLSWLLCMGYAIYCFFNTFELNVSFTQEDRHQSFLLVAFNIRARVRKAIFRPCAGGVGVVT
jgi:hypothetical protein